MGGAGVRNDEFHDSNIFCFPDAGTEVGKDVGLCGKTNVLWKVGNSFLMRGVCVETSLWLAVGWRAVRETERPCVHVISCRLGMNVFYTHLTYYTGGG